MKTGDGQASPREVSQDIFYLRYILLVCGSPNWTSIVEMWSYEGFPDCLEEICAPVLKDPQDPVRLPGCLCLSDVNLVPVAAIVTVLETEIPHVADKLDGILASIIGLILLYRTASHYIGFVAVYQHPP